MLCAICNKKVPGWDTLIFDGKVFHSGCYYDKIDKEKNESIHNKG